MRLFKVLTSSFLALVLISNPVVLMAEPVPPELENLVPANDRSLAQIARERTEQVRNAPAWLKAILVKRVRSYFPGLRAQDQKLDENSVNQMLDDATRVATAFEEDDRSGEFRDFIAQNLIPFIRGLKAKQVAGKLGDWTMQTLVVSRMLNFLSQAPEFPKKALGLITGPHLKFASRLAVPLVLLSVGYYLFPHFEQMAGLFIVLTLWDSFKAGPVGQILSAGSGWFVRPTSEQARVLESRYTSKLETRINSFFDRLNPKTDLAPQSTTSDGEDRNDRVRISTLENDGMDFAGMSPEDQLANWDQGVNMFVVVAKRFSQLLRDTHHAGRDMMMLSWTDQQNIAQLVETLDSKMIILRAETEGVLNPHKTAFLIRGENQRKIDLEAAFEHFEWLCNRIWQEPTLAEGESQQLALEIESARDRLVEEFGLSAQDIKRLLVIQQERSRAASSMATTLAIGELRAFYGAERNRNLAPKARLIERRIRAGLGMQYFVDRHLPNVQDELRGMNQRVSGRVQVSAPEREKCLIIELRRAFRMPAVTISNSEACSRLLWGTAEKPRFDAGNDNNPISNLLKQFNTTARRNEVISVLNEAAFTQAHPLDLQSGAQTALARCAN